MNTNEIEEIRLADVVWIATALLHRAHPERADFAVSEIVARAEAEAVTPRRLSGVYQHAQTHCVANRNPAPARLRMLVETGRTRRRLFRPGDPYTPAREGGRTVPERSDLPPQYRELLDWYEKEYVAARRGASSPKLRSASVADPLLQLRGLGKELWRDEDPDAYVRRLREGWS